MGFLSRILPSRPARHETRAGAPNADAFLAQHFGARGLAGAVSPGEALSALGVAARCVSLRSNSLASVGLHLFRRNADGGRSRADDAPLYGVLHDLFNPNMSAYEGREFLIRSLDLWGNAYAVIERNARGQVIALHPVPPANVTPERLASGRLRYRVNHAPRTGVFLQEDMLHIRGPSSDGMIGQSPIRIAAGALGVAISQRETQAALLENSLRPSGVFSYPEKLSPAAQSAVSASLKDFQGPGKAGRVMIMDAGAKYEPMTFTPHDAQFLEQTRLANEDVARIFDCPPTAVGITDRATYSNSEHEGKALVSMCLGPLAARIETAMARCLLTEAGRRSLYIEHDLSGLLRGDVESRFKAYRLGREIGALSANDVRRRENEPPIEGGDAYHVPANWTGLGAMPQTGKEGGP
jgi:HK97 family phage portal protein